MAKDAEDIGNARADKGEENTEDGDKRIEDSSSTEDVINTQDANSTERARSNKDAAGIKDAGSTQDARSSDDIGRINDAYIKDSGSNEDARSNKDAGKIGDATGTQDARNIKDAGDAEVAASIKDAINIEDGGSTGDAGSIKDARSPGDAGSIKDSRSPGDAESSKDAGCACEDCSEQKRKLRRSLNKTVFVLCSANFLLNSFHAACFSTTGVIRLELQHKFPDEKNILITLVGALKLTMMGIAGLVVGPLVDRYGVHKAAPVGTATIVGGNIITFVATNLSLIIFSYGFLPGIGYNIFAITVAVSAQKHIKAKRVGLVNGFIMAGQGVGIFAWSSFLEYLIRQYGFNGAVLIEGACVLNVIIIIQVIYYADNEATRLEAKLAMRGDLNVRVENQESGDARQLEVSSPEETNANNEENNTTPNTCNQHKWKLLRPFKIIVKYPGFLVYCSSLFLVHIGDLSTYYILPSRGKEAGASSEQSASMITVVGACNTVGRIFFGWISDFEHIAKRRNYLVGLVAIVTGLTAITCAFFPIYWVSQVYSVVFGTGAGCYMGLLNTMTVLLVPLEHMKIATGFLYGIMGVAWPLALIFSELLESGFGSTFPVFLMIGVCLVLGGMGLCSISRFTGKKQ